MTRLAAGNPKLGIRGPSGGGSVRRLAGEWAREPRIDVVLTPLSAARHRRKKFFHISWWVSMREICLRAPSSGVRMSYS